MICVVGLLEGRQAKLRTKDVLDPTPFLIYVRNRREQLKRQHDDFWGHLMGELGMFGSQKTFERNTRRWETAQPLVLLETIEDFLAGPGAPFLWELYPEASRELEEREVLEPKKPRMFGCETCGAEVIYDAKRRNVRYCSAECRYAGRRKHDRARKRRQAATRRREMVG